MTRSLLKVALVGLILALASIAHAENVVLIVVPTGENLDYTPFENRLRSELVAAGFPTVTATIPGPIDAASLPSHAARLSTNIAISISISGDIVFGYVSISGTPNGRGTVRAVPGYPIGEQAPSVFAVRATDVLHGALLELSHAPNAAPSTPPLSTPTRQTSPREDTRQPQSKAPSSASAARLAGDAPAIKGRPRTPHLHGNWGVTIASTFIASLRSMPVAPGAELGFYRQERLWGASLDAALYLPVSAMSSSAEIEASQWRVGGALQLLQPIGASITAVEFLAAGVHGFDIEGTSANPANDRHPYATTAYTGLGVGLIAGLRDRTGVFGKVSVVAPWREVDIVVSDRVAARLAFPIAFCDLGLRLAF